MSLAFRIPTHLSVIYESIIVHFSYAPFSSVCHYKRWTKTFKIKVVYSDYVSMVFFLNKMFRMNETDRQLGTEDTYFFYLGDSV